MTRAYSLDLRERVVAAVMDGVRRSALVRPALVLRPRA